VGEPSKGAMEIVREISSGLVTGRCACETRTRVFRDGAEAIDAHAAELVAAHVKRSVDEERRRWMAILRHHHDPDDKPRPLWKWRLYIHQIELCYARSDGTNGWGGGTRGSSTFENVLGA
jgi:hypothetical protein